MRLIDAHKLTDHLQMVQKRDGLWGAIDRVVMEVIDRFVREEPTVDAAPRWHRVEVEEPTKAGWYLVMDEDGDFNVDEWHNTFGWRFITKFDADRITHWMPIEPPKEDA